MAGIALCRRIDVGRRLGLCIDCQVVSAMAGRTLSSQTCVAHLGRGKCNIILVAGITSCRRRNMRSILAERVSAIVATSTGTGNYATVIIGCRLPDRCRMAGIAGLVRRDVCRSFGTRTKRRVGPAMTVYTLADRAGVVHAGRFEAREVGVTAIALATRRQVVGRFAQRRRAVMAGRATATTDDDG